MIIFFLFDNYVIIKAILLDPEEMNVEEFSHIAEIPNAFIILCMATYGEGNPTDNAQELHEYISNNEMDLSGVRYAVPFFSFTIYG